MDDPIKVIHKYKNNNGKVHYHIQIFVGDIMDDSCMKVLKKIAALDLYDTLVSLEERETNLLIKNYGDYWYEKLFNSHHITFIKETTLKNPTRMKELQTIYGDEWVTQHFTDYKKHLKTISYSYENMIKDERERKVVKKVIQQQQGVEENIDYSTKVVEQSRVEDLFTSDSSDEQVIYSDDDDKFIGGDDDEVEEEEVPQFDFENTAEVIEGNEFENEVEQDLENVDLIFDELDETDKNIKKTTQEIKDAISKETYNKINNKIADFDTDKDDNMFNELLKDVYTKHYITTQYIYKDDTIRTIRNKICCGFKNNNRFGEATYIIPFYQYLWSEYLLEGKVERVMIGQKWVIKNDVVKLDVEPNTNLGSYEDLRGNLKLLRDNVKRQGKIKRDDDDTNILADYENYYTLNEIYMIDLLNDLGMNYDPNFEELKNLADVYLKIYFPRVRIDDMKLILDFLQTSVPETKKVAERNKSKLIFESINNDLILENEIMRDIELAKKKNKKEYLKLFKENYVIQSIIRVYLVKDYKKLDLFRIFDNFALDDKYPFIQYQSNDGVARYRYNEKALLENENKDIIVKWFENSPYGISFKIKLELKSGTTSDKYIAINLSDIGRVDYKISWKEDDMYTVDDIDATYVYIFDLIKKINRENEKYHINIGIPHHDDFKFAFINTIQRFELPDDLNINHNDLSEFSRYFYPYIALVIEPRKRESKLNKYSKSDKSKFGTYLRYKRVSKYENKTKIEHRIVFFMRNYEFNDKSLANEISKEFNITEELAMTEIVSVKNKYPYLKKSRKILKKLENIPKYKPPGIGIDIQGKTRNRYKMRIAGARDKEQLNRIITFMNILIYLYMDTYLYKRPERQKMKDRLSKLTKIARRRNKVDEVVIHDSPIKTIKQMAANDRKRLSYKPEEDQNQWSRDCQNSGKNKKRRPQQFLDVEDLIKAGYVWNDRLENFEYGHYEKKVMVDTGKGGKKQQVTLRAIKLPLDDTGENFVYYTCDPKENGQHMYVGLLSKSKTPNREAGPCCFIKDQFYSKNDAKRNILLKSLGIIQDTTGVAGVAGDQLYILLDSNKIQEGRFVYLPKYLDIFMNYMLGNTRKVKNNYLLETEGYYLKYGVKNDMYRYLSAICAIFEITVDELKNRLIKVLQDDKHMTVFTSLNNGDIRSRFVTIDKYIYYIQTNEYLEYQLLNDLLCLPKVLSKNGVNIIIFQKKLTILRKKLEKEQVKVSYYIICQNAENLSDLLDPSRETVFIIRENKNYYPIILIKKENEQLRDIVVVKKFNYENDPKNIVNHLLKYYTINCKSEFSILINDKTMNNYNAKEVYKILRESSNTPKYQIVDAKFKCNYIITKNKSIIPVIPSGSIPNLQIAPQIKPFLQDYAATRHYLTELATTTDLKLKPIGVFYSEMKGDDYIVTDIMTENYEVVPMIEQLMTAEQVASDKLLVQYKSNNYLIDREIAAGPKNIVIDNRIYSVSKNNYETEMYQLFRFHLSYYLNNVATGIKFKGQLERIINDTGAKRQRKLAIKKLLYEMSDRELARTFTELIKENINAASENKWIHVFPDTQKVDYPAFVIKNNRELCYDKTRDTCHLSYCNWVTSKNMCMLNIQQRLLIDSINKVTEELIQNELKASEILRRDNYFVSDIINYNIYTERPGERIIMNSNNNLTKVLNQIFGKENIPNIGKRRNKLNSAPDYLAINLENPMKDLNNWYIQKIVDNNNTIFRAFANSYFWLLHPYSDASYRNLGYYSELQTNLANIYKSQVIDWLLVETNTKTLDLPSFHIKPGN